MRSGRLPYVWAASAVALLALILTPVGISAPKHVHATARQALVPSPPAAPVPRAEHPRTRPLGVTTGALAAYASATSVNRGGRIAFAVSTQSPTYDVAIERFGAGSIQQMRLTRGLGGRDQGYWIQGTFGVSHCPTCVVNTRTGQVLPRWAWTYALDVPPTWPSGLYRAVFTSRAGSDAVPFVVRADGEGSPVLVVISFNTYQAYNDWGGKSLYGYNSFGPRTVSGATQAVTVSFLRPYGKTKATGAPLIGYGTASDWMLATWLARHRIAADYISDVDLSADPALVHGRRLVIFPGHSEYWSQAEYDAAVAARDAGVSLAFLGGNDVFWRVRYEDSSDSLVEYRKPALDPLAGDPAQVTGRFDSTQVDEPQSRLTGTLYESGVPYYGLPWTVTSAAPAWLLQGSGLKPGRSVQHAVGGECDRYYSGVPQPADVTVVAQTSFLHGIAVCSSTIYQASSGAWVFNAGDMDWDVHLLTGGPIAAVTADFLAHVGVA